jgi:hypothetical protein
LKDNTSDVDKVTKVSMSVYLEHIFESNKSCYCNTSDSWTDLCIRRLHFGENIGLKLLRAETATSYCPMDRNTAKQNANKKPQQDRKMTV